MSFLNDRCDICYKLVPKGTPEQEEAAIAAAKARGDWEPDPRKRVLVCDPCWQRAIKRGWKPGYCFVCKQALPHHKLQCPLGRAN